MKCLPTAISHNFGPENEFSEIMGTTSVKRSLYFQRERSYYFCFTHQHWCVALKKVSCETCGHKKLKKNSCKRTAANPGCWAWSYSLRPFETKLKCLTVDSLLVTIGTLCKINTQLWFITIKNLCIFILQLGIAGRRTTSKSLGEHRSSEF